MMSYLWILLLGSLLATHAKAQDDVTPTLEPSAKTPTSEASVEIIDQHNLGEGVTAAEKVSLAVSQPEPTADPETEIIQEANSADVSTEPATTDAPAGEEGQSASPTTGKTEPIISEAPTATQAADSEDNAPETTQTAVNEEEQPTTTANTTPAQDKNGLHDIITTVRLEANEEAPTDPSTNEESSTDDFRALTEENVTLNPGFNLEMEEEKTSVTVQETHGLNQENPIKEVVPRLKSDARLLTEDKENNGVPAMGASESDKQPRKASSSSLAGILSAIVVSAVGAIAGYFTYQQKKLCFKNRQEADPEAPHKADAAEARSDPQVLSNLLNSS